MSRRPPARDLALIRQACWREEALDFRYEDELRAITRRTVLPLAIVYAERRLVVLAWCCLRTGFRMFRLDRILEVRADGSSFRPRRASLLRDYLAEREARERAEGKTPASAGQGGASEKTRI